MCVVGMGYIVRALCEYYHPVSLRDRGTIFFIPPRGEREREIGHRIVGRGRGGV